VRIHKGTGAVREEEISAPGLRRRTVKAKFHYASWFEAGLKLVADSFEPVCDQLRTSFEPASVMEFGFNSMRGSWSEVRYMNVIESRRRGLQPEVRHQLQ